MENQIETWTELSFQKPTGQRVYQVSNLGNVRMKLLYGNFDTKEEVARKKAMRKEGVLTEVKTRDERGEEELFIKIYLRKTKSRLYYNFYEDLKRIGLCISDIYEQKLFTVNNTVNY